MTKKMLQVAMLIAVNCVFRNDNYKIPEGKKGTDKGKW